VYCTQNTLHGLFNKYSKMNCAYIYYFNTDLKIIQYTNSPLAHRIAKPPKLSFPWCITCLIPMQKESHVFAPTGTPQLPLCTAALCNKSMHSLFSSDLGMEDKIIPSTASLYTVWNILPTRHSGCKLHLAVSNSVHQWGSPVCDLETSRICTPYIYMTLEA
jgi:hypothetical protein